MNKARRKEIYRLIRALYRLKFNDDLGDCVDTLHNIKYDEEYAYNHIPENLQYSYRAEQSEEAIEHMEDALSYLNDAQNSEEESEFKECIKNAIDELSNATV